MNSAPEVRVVYDKQCPVCDYYTNLIQIRKSAGRLILIDARDDGPIMEEITARGLDIDKGMVVKVGDAFYHGADAVHVLALMGSERDLFNRITCRLFRSKAVAHAIYPALERCRNGLLKLLGRKPINNLGAGGKH